VAGQLGSCQAQADTGRYCCWWWCWYTWRWPTTLSALPPRNPWLVLPGRQSTAGTLVGSTRVGINRAGAVLAFEASHCAHASCSSGTPRYCHICRQRPRCSCILFGTGLQHCHIDIVHATMFVAALATKAQRTACRTDSVPAQLIIDMLTTLARLHAAPCLVCAAEKVPLHTAGLP
jgi:hypothetical protein